MSTIVDVTLGMVNAKANSLEKEVTSLKKMLSLNYQTSSDSARNIAFQVEKTTYTRAQLDVFLENMISKTNADARYVRQNSTEFTDMIEKIKESMVEDIKKKANEDDVYSKNVIDIWKTDVYNLLSEKVTKFDYNTKISQLEVNISKKVDVLSMSTYVTAITNAMFNKTTTAEVETIFNSKITTALSSYVTSASMANYVKDDGVTTVVFKMDPYSLADGTKFATQGDVSTAITASETNIVSIINGNISSTVASMTTAALAAKMDTNNGTLGSGSKMSSSLLSGDIAAVANVNDVTRAIDSFNTSKCGTATDPSVDITNRKAILFNTGAPLMASTNNRPMADLIEGTTLQVSGAPYVGNDLYVSLSNSSTTIQSRMNALFVTMNAMANLIDLRYLTDTEVESKISLAVTGGVSAAAGTLMAKSDPSLVNVYPTAKTATDFTATYLATPSTTIFANEQYVRSLVDLRISQVVTGTLTEVTGGQLQAGDAEAGHARVGNDGSGIPLSPVNLAGYASQKWVHTGFYDKDEIEDKFRNISMPVYATLSEVGAKIAKQTGSVMVNSLDIVKTVAPTGTQYVIDLNEGSIFYLSPATGVYNLVFSNEPVIDPSTPENEGIASYIEIRVKPVAGFGLTFPIGVKVTDDTIPGLKVDRETHFGIDVTVVMGAGSVPYKEYVTRLLSTNISSAGSSTSTVNAV